MAACGRDERGEAVLSAHERSGEKIGEAKKNGACWPLARQPHLEDVEALIRKNRATIV